MTRASSQDRALRERAAAVIPGGMYGHQAVGLLAAFLFLCVLHAALVGFYAHEEG